MLLSPFYAFAKTASHHTENMALFDFICRSSEMYFFVIKLFHKEEEPSRFALYPRSSSCSPAGKHRFESFRRNF